MRDMYTVNQIEKMVDRYHYVYKEFSGVIRRADEQHTPILDIVDEPRHTEKLSNFAYGMSCSICDQVVGSRDRVRLVAKGEVRTLCEEHLDNVLDLRKAISNAHRMVNKTLKQEIKEQAKSIRWEWRREQKVNKTNNLSNTKC